MALTMRKHSTKFEDILQGTWPVLFKQCQGHERYGMNENCHIVEETEKNITGGKISEI